VEQRAVGRSGLAVSHLALGTMTWTGEASATDPAVTEGATEGSAAP
jgi:aryl-alcohol dehydrogenase-like predicted oxidoreductase